MPASASPYGGRALPSGSAEALACSSSAYGRSNSSQHRGSSVNIGLIPAHDLTDEDNRTWVRDALVELLRSLPAPRIGITSLRPGADQLFASTVLDTGGEIFVVQPDEAPVDSGETGPQVQTDIFNQLLERALDTELVGATTEKSAEACTALRRCQLTELYIVIWDPTVEAARAKTLANRARNENKKVITIDPTARTVVASV